MSRCHYLIVHHNINAIEKQFHLLGVTTTPRTSTPTYIELRYRLMEIAMDYEVNAYRGSVTEILSVDIGPFLFLAFCKLLGPEKLAVIICFIL